MINIIKRKLSRIKDELLLLWFLIKNYQESKNLSKLSVLARGKSKDYSVKKCPICKSNNVHIFARFPLGIPGCQNHALLYFDYEEIEMGLLKNRKKVLDKTSGFFVSVSWNFCSDCRNGSISTYFTSEHMTGYYTDFYRRAKETDKLRRNTKELHGGYLSSLVAARSNILEIGAADGITAEYLARQGHKIYVYEPSNQFTEILKKSELIVYVDDYKSLGGTMDAIYLHHVLEHIPDPINYLRGLFHCLKKDGFLLIQVPDLYLQYRIIEKIARRSIYSLFNRPRFAFKKVNRSKTSQENSSGWFDVLANDHINAFTDEGLKYIIAQAGYCCEVLIQSTQDRITYDNIRYAWPVDEMTGNTPNGLTIIARKTQPDNMEA